MIAGAKALTAAAGAVAHAVGEFIDSSNKIWVTLNQHSYVAGDMVSGNVEMDCVVPFFAKGVVLRVKGFERVWWQYQETEYEGEGQNRKAIQVTREQKENKEFFKQTIVVYPHQGTVAPGHYSFPFLYQLPPNLPGTYHEEGGHNHNGTGYHAKVLYKVKASVDVHFRHNLHHTARLVVNEKFDQLLAPSYAENQKSFLTGGNLHIRTWLDKNAYMPGETMLAKMKANNTSVKPTRRIRIKVFHNLELRAHGRTKQIYYKEYEQDFPGFEPCFYGLKWMPFHVPVSLRPSSLLGHHVHSSYIFEIECDIPGATDLSVKLPVRLLAPQFLWSSVPPQPANAPLPPSVQVRPPWQPDNQAPSCGQCFTAFSLLKRRHHCRHCAKVFCSKCTTSKVAIPKLKYKEAVRVCNTCLPTAQQGGRKYQSGKQIMAQWQQSQNPAAGMVPNGASYSPPPPGAPYSPPPSTDAPSSPPPPVANYSAPAAALSY